MQATTWSTGNCGNTYKRAIKPNTGYLSMFPGRKDAQIGNFGMYNN